MVQILWLHIHTVRSVTFPLQIVWLTRLKAFEKTRWKHARYLCVCDILTCENLLDVFLLEPFFRCSLFVLWGFHVSGFRCYRSRMRARLSIVFLKCGPAITFLQKMNQQNWCIYVWGDGDVITIEEMEIARRFTMRRANCCRNWSKQQFPAVVLNCRPL